MSPRTVPDRPPTQAGRDGSSRYVPPALVLLALFPVVAGSLRLVELAGGPAVLPTNPRIDSFPLPVVIHVLAATVYAFLGASQFSARLRRRRPALHRRSGRVLVGAGLLVAGSALWMTLSYPGAPGGDLLWGVRLVVGSATAAFLVLGFAAIRRRAIAAHRAWMIRAYALALGAGTQVVTQGVGEGLFGAGDPSVALSISAGWVVNAVVAEWVVRRGRGAPAAVAGPR